MLFVDIFSGLGPFTTGSMENTALQDLELRVGCPYVYVHQVIFSLARIKTPFFS
jgi:hypothetical protein